MPTLPPPVNASTDTNVTTTQWWKVTVHGIFVYGTVHFEPGFTFYVPDALYNGMLADGTTTFASMCDTATPVTSY